LGSHQKLLTNRNMYQFSSQNIRWVKNVKRAGGTDWAYFDPGMEAEFNLNFSESQKFGAVHIGVEDILLLFQRVDHISGVSAKTYLTHLVKPLDQELIYNDATPLHPWERRVAVIARAEPRTSIHTNAGDLNFFKPNWGKVCPIQLLSDHMTEAEIQERIVALFHGHFAEGATNYIDSIGNILNDLSAEDFSALEGAEMELFRLHIVRERSPELIRRAKAQGLRKGNGQLLCECCDFNFTENYGAHGAGFIECHHRVFVSIGGQRVNTVGDLALVCANCHRMLHRKNDQGWYYTVEEIANIRDENKKRKI
jgi:hypothetical protein